MEKANAAEIRKAIEAVDLFKMHGILFVPMPVLGPEDKRELVKEIQRRLDIIIEDSE